MGESRTATITFTNSGTADLSNIQIGSTEKQNSAVITSKGTCAGTIIAGNTCNFTVSYTPQKAEAGNMILQVSAEYADQSRAGQLSLISNVLYFNYNANSRQVFLTANGSQDGFNRCDLAADGKSLINCVVAGAGASSSNKLGGLLYKFGISFFRSANESITAYVSRGDDSAARDGLAICNMTNAGDFNGCTVPDTGAIMVQNRVANIFGSNYLFTTNANYTDSISTKAKLRESDGSITVASSGGTWENVDATPNQATNNQGVAVYKQYVYISQFYINNVVTNVLKCTVMPNGSWKSGYSACTRSDSGTQDDVYSSEVVTLNKQAYLYMATNLSARRMIVRCKLQESDGNFNSSDCKMALNNQAGAYPGTTEKYTTIAGSPRTLTYMKINGNNYLYYGAQEGVNRIWRTKILDNNGTLDIPESVPYSTSTGATLFSNVAGMMPFISYPSAKVAFWQSQQTYTKNTNYTESIAFTASSAINSSSVTFTAPAGITLSPASVNLTRSTPTTAITLSIGSTVTSGIYTIKGTSNNGVQVADWNIVIN